MPRTPGVKRQKELLASHQDLLGIVVTNGNNFCRVFNPGPTKVYLSYRRPERGRWYRSAAWQVVGVNVKTDPEAHWMDYGNKTFIITNRASKDDVLFEACAWAHAQGYGGTQWSRDPFGDYQTPATMTAFHVWLSDIVKAGV